MKSRQHDLIVAFYPHARGFAYVVFEGPFSPVDWGMSDVPGKVKARRCLRRLSLLLDRYQPDAVVIRGASNERRMRSMAGLLATIEEEVGRRGIFMETVTRKHIRETFAYLGSPTRYAIVEAIAKHIPMFASYAPPIRKIWNGEDRRMGLFDAVALALVFFKNQKGGRDDASYPNLT